MVSAAEPVRFPDKTSGPVLPLLVLVLLTAMVLGASPAKGPLWVTALVALLLENVRVPPLRLMVPAEESAPELLCRCSLPPVFRLKIASAAMDSRRLLPPWIVKL